MEFISSLARDSDDSGSGNEVEEQSNTDDQDYFDDTEIDQNPSNNYWLTNVTRSFSDAEMMREVIERYKNQETIVRNHTLLDDDSQEDEPADSKRRTKFS